MLLKQERLRMEGKEHLNLKSKSNLLIIPMNKKKNDKKIPKKKKPSYISDYKIYLD